AARPGRAGGRCHGRCPPARGPRDGAGARAAVRRPRGGYGAMNLVRTVAEMRQVAQSHMGTVGLVPTMGALHDGHLSLFGAARDECDLVVASLFVNPAQFGANEDLDRYPRDEARDAKLAEDSGVDVLFAPAPDELYPNGFRT